MLRKKARPKRKSNKSRLLNITNITCKGLDNNLLSIYHDIVYTNNKFGKALLNSIPVLSIFVLLGIITYSTIVIGFGEVDGEAYAETLNTNTSLIIDNGTATDSTATVRNGVAYSSHTVQVSASNITGYTLSITGPASLSNGGTTIGGAGGKTGAQLASADTGWGYGWNTTSTTNANMTYNSFTGSAQTLSGDSISNNSINFTRKLVFAAKFSQDAIEGHYKANVKLNLTVTPKAVATGFSVNYEMNGGSGGPSNITGTINDGNYVYTIPSVTPTKFGYKFDGYNENNGATAKYKPGDKITLTPSNPSIALFAVWVLKLEGINNMQEMTPAVCKNSAIGDSNSLIDTRDYSSYTVQKLTDGNCWMVQNLRLNLNKAGVATKADSDNLSADYPYKAIAMVSKSSLNATAEEWYSNSTGNLYSWCAATAGTCSDATTSNANAPSSICPRNWHLPQAKSNSWTDNDFIQLMRNTVYNGWIGNDMVTESNFPTSNFAGVYITASKLVIINSDGYSTGFHLGGADWPYFGVLSQNGYSSIASCWSRTASGSSNAFQLLITGKNQLYPAATTFHRGYGLAIHCVAYSS